MMKHFNCRNRHIIIFGRPYILLCFIMGLNACSKLVDVPVPVTSISTGNVYSNDASTISVSTGILADLARENIKTEGNLAATSFFLGMLSDELTLGITSNTVYSAYYSNALGQQIGVGYTTGCYKYIYRCNTIIDGINNYGKDLTPAVKSQVIGEALFLRSLMYYYLINIYGDVPYTTSIDYAVNKIIAKTDKQTILKNLVSDLMLASQDLNDNFLDVSLLKTTTERVRPTKSVANALLARVYLLQNDWVNAEQTATATINNAMFSLVPLKSVFLKNSNEAVWQLQTVSNSYNTDEGFTFNILTVPDNNHPVSLSSYVVNLFSNTDQRLSTWIRPVTNGGKIYYCPFKYQSYKIAAPTTEYRTVFRLGEQFLIRAEARAQQNKLDSGLNDLNRIRQRAGLLPVVIQSKDSLIAEILTERRRELFTEFGARWIDLKRTNTIDAVMSTVTTAKGGTWRKEAAVLPFPNNDIIRDPNLVQNPGY